MQHGQKPIMSNSTRSRRMSFQQRPCRRSQLTRAQSSSKATFYSSDRAGCAPILSYQKHRPRTLQISHLPPAVGIKSSEQTLCWLWETGFAAVAGDMPSMEAWPCQDTQFWLHEWLLAGWGIPIGELFGLERLSEECRRQGRWSFFFSSVPLRVSKLLRFISSPMLQVDDSSRYPEESPAHLTEWQFCSLHVYNKQNTIFCKESRVL
jgi:hypothetical protein